MINDQLLLTSRDQNETWAFYYYLYNLHLQTSFVGTGLSWQVIEGQLKWTNAVDKITCNGNELKNISFLGSASEMCQICV